MDTKAAIFALMTAWGVGTCAPVTAQETEATSEAAAEATSDNRLLNRVWVRQNDGSELPGAMLVFLADGTLVSDSC